MEQASHSAAVKNVKPPEFGKDMRNEEFSLDPDVTFLNHPTYGVVPKRVKAEHLRLMDEFDANPVLFGEVTSHVYRDRSTRAVAEFVGAKPRNLVLVENATRGINDVLKSFKWKPTDRILHSNLAHAAVRNTILEVTSKVEGLAALEVAYTYPFTKEAILQQYQQMLSSTTVRLAVIEHITSAPPLVLPVKELISLCHDKGVLVLVDGAHAPGHIKLDLEDLGADFYVGTLYKWLYTSRGCAFLYASPKHHDWLTPAVTSFAYDQHFPGSWQQQGARDDSAMINVAASVEFYNWIGGWEAINGHTSRLLEEAVLVLTRAWGTESLTVPEEMQPPNFRTIRLPKLANYPPPEGEPGPYEKIMQDIYARFKVWTAIFNYRGDLWLRLASAIYCTMADVTKVKDVILTLESDPVEVD